MDDLVQAVRAAFQQAVVLAVREIRQSNHPGVLKDPAHHPTALDVLTVVRYGDRADVLQLRLGGVQVDPAATRVAERGESPRDDKVLLEAQRRLVEIERAIKVLHIHHHM